MMGFLIYLLKVTICSALLTGYYYGVLRNRHFHQWNRFYLLLAVLLSLTIPLFRFTIFHNSEDDSTAIQLLQAVSIGDEYVAYATRNSQPLISLEQGLTLLYTAVALGLLGGLLLSLVRIRQLVRKHTARSLDNIRFINAPEKGTPFSFFHYIFWNPSIDLRSETGERIFQHELVHVREGHSVDKLLMQVVLVFFWCNPFFWIIRHELRMIHE
ncbi:MAG TPA: M56 family metallopeptidase, partial [Chitinophagaceae bacterium]